MTNGSQNDDGDEERVFALTSRGGAPIPVPVDTIFTIGV